MVSQKTGKKIKGFSKKALRLMHEYDWPGNVREVENTVERCVIISDKEFIDVEDFPVHMQNAGDPKKFDDSAPFFSYDNIIPFEKIKEEAIRHALKFTKGNIMDAANKLQLGRATLYRLIEKYSINTDEYETSN